MSDKFLHVDAQNLRASIADLRADFPEISEDEQLLLDTLEGETDFFAIVARALEEREDAAVLADAIGRRIASFQARKHRMERKEAAMRRLILKLMTDAGQNKLVLPDATLSVTKPRTTVNVLEINDLPQGYYRVERKADKAAIKSALEQGETIPGAELATGESGLMIRTT